MITNFVAAPAAPTSAQGSTAQPAARASRKWDELKWNDLLAQLGSPARNAELTAELEKLGASDPDRAMALAGAEGNRKLRDQLTQAALHGWARTAPTNAAQWAMNLTDSDKREAALSTVFAGAAASNPDLAISVANFIVAQNPNDAIGYGSRLVDALCDSGNFQKAAQMATGGDTQTQSPWMSEAYSRWAEFQPIQAAEAAAAITDPTVRNQALHGIVGGWSQADPAGLVQFASQLPVEADRDALVSQSLERWVREDAAAAVQWINGQPANANLDQGAAAVATMESIEPKVASSWAETVVDPELRSETLANVLRNWLTANPAEAENYFNSTEDLLPDDRQQIADLIASKHSEASTQ